MLELIMENLRVYQVSLDLVTQIYSLIKNNSELSKDYALNDQLRRASISIVANIAEGYKEVKSSLKITFISLLDHAMK